ncbi:acetyl-CoA carboxylase-like isoform X2 [Dendronephthya gigantea]|uniref:acetyl-CoA carboxylase-like isoform X2 n=1 Tax=Dendronephthya gigantea TaxID=151771 RepID=UPI00106925C7|nr:acetyl-CoA carboxylase-like isoform X2 [Dendronephthya gigantea]
MFGFQKNGIQADSTAKDDTKVASPAEFVKRFGGDTVIEKVLIANNGIAAVKCMRSIRRWCYDLFGNEHAIRFVAMVTPEDLKANAEYIKLADHYVHAPGGTNNNNYANVDVILDIAKRIPVQAVWAGWGHASENPLLPDVLKKNNIMFMGPPAGAMWALGDKIASSIVAQSLNIPTLKWSGSGVTIDVNTLASDLNTGELVSEELYQKCCITDATAGVKIAQDIGYPVMIKASEGGGGKGIRKAHNDDEFSNFFRQVQTEVPGSPIFVMKVASRARHLEVQILADRSGEAISLFGRDCSVQRRHQKIIEEAPVVICPAEILQQMEKDAVKLAKLVKYVSAGTVEYLYTADDQKYYFLELNPRLQVEHPCTEMIADINLPAAQLQIAMGIPLDNIKDIRNLYSKRDYETTRINFAKPSNQPKPKGHVIAARITAENPDEGFKPSSGTVQELNFRSSSSVWGYFSVAPEGALHEYADSQFGHCFAWGEDRDRARRNMVMALKEISIRGDFRTTVEYLVKLLEEERFQTNKFDTTWLDHLIAEKVQAEKPDTILAVICGSIHVVDSHINKRFSSFQHGLERGQILPAHMLTNTECVELIYDNDKYCVKVSKIGPNPHLLEMNSSTVEVDVHRLSDGGLLICYDGSCYTTYMKEEVDRYRLTIAGKTCVFQKQNDPSKLRSPSAGKLIAYTVEDGGHVFQGETYAEIEVMKMVMPLTVAESGCVHFIKSPNAVLDPGTVVASLELDDPNRVTQAQLYQGEFPILKGPSVKGDKLHQVFHTARENLQHVMTGYAAEEPHFTKFLDQNVELLTKTLKDPKLPLMELKELLSSISGRIPETVEEAIHRLLANYASNITSVLSQFPSQQIANVVDAHAATLTKRADREAFFLNTQSIVQLVQRYRNGCRGHMKSVIVSLLRQYLQVESLFSEGNFDKCVLAIREENKENDMSAVVANVFSHANVPKKNVLMVKLIDMAGSEQNLKGDLLTALQELTTLVRQEHAKVALRARQVLIQSQQPSYELRHNQFESIFLSSISYGSQFSPEVLQKLINSETAIFDVLPSFFYHSNEFVRMAALEVYIRRSYEAYELTTLQHEQLGERKTIITQFKFILPASHPNRHTKVSSPVNKTSHHKGHQAMTRVYSLSEDLHDLPSHSHSHDPCERTGLMAAFRTFDDFQKNFSKIMSRFESREKMKNSSSFPGNNAAQKSSQMKRNVSLSAPSSGASLQTLWEAGDETGCCKKIQEEEPIHIINIALTKSGICTCMTDCSSKLLKYLQSKKPILLDKGIRRITFLVTDCKGSSPWYFTYRASSDFNEDAIYRHLEPALAFQLELNRLRNFDLESVPTTNHSIHLYFASAKKVSANAEVTDHRFYVRTIVRHADFVSKEASFEYLEKESEIQCLETLDQLEIAFEQSPKRTDCNHLFLNFVPCIVIEPHKMEESIRSIVIRYGKRLWRLRVLQAEMKMNIRLSPNGQKIPIRVYLSNESGYYLDVSIYRETEDQRTGQIVLESYGLKQGPLHGLLVNSPYVTKDRLQLKRFTAQNQGTTYVYDIPELFKQAVLKYWKQWSKEHGKDINLKQKVVEASEYVLKEDGQLHQVNRLAGENNIGVVAWRMALITPEYPEGREIIVVANDITHVIGSFAVQEDTVFERALQLALNAGIPFIYVSANSGARLGLAEDLKLQFKVAWEDSVAPEKGFKYLYLTTNDFKKLSASNSVRAEAIEENEESRYKITDVIGRDDPIGVENLRGSGMIAGAMSKAYDEVVTISLVTCRAVGIGAYLLRLGQRVIQVENSHIILTGYGALNKLLGSQVYTSNLQLGGPSVMHNNGTSHLVVPDDLSGLFSIIQWLSYIPRCKNAPLPVTKIDDPVEREIDFVPSRVCDPRHMLAGKKENDKWITGFFDKNSFIETLDGWAKTVVCGRARLGGIPMGVIAVETRAVEVTIPADPGNPSSEAQLFTQAGQVWYPDSAFKTAQCIKDFNREQLPLIIFANWRGFSGGLKDMYEEVLKYGSLIVDALRKYQQPVFVYIPCNAELRGGAWVVLDPTINPQVMEMYADEESRGGILEPAGAVEIKFRRKDLVKAMRRLDDTYSKLMHTLAAPDLSIKDRKTVEKQLKEREEILLPVYQQVAITFADLHDTAGRMHEKGVVSEVLKWKKSRKFFYWRLRRLLLEKSVKQKLGQANKDLSDGQLSSMLERLFLEDHGTVKSYMWNDNEVVVKWFESDMAKEEGSVIAENIKWIKRDSVLRQIKSLVQENADVAMDSIIHITQQMSQARRAEVARILEAFDSTKSSNSNGSGNGSDNLTE